MNSQIFRGARIIDFVENLALESFAKTNVLNLAVDCPPEDFEKYLLRPLATQRAYANVITFFNNLFNIDSTDNKVFRKTRHRGVK